RPLVCWRLSTKPSVVFSWVPDLRLPSARWFGRTETGWTTRHHGQLEGSEKSHRVCEGDAKDYPGHADGRGGEAAPRPGGGDRRAPLCRPHGSHSRQSQPADHEPGRAVAAARWHRA